MAYSLETSSVKTIVPGATVSGFCDVVARQKINELSGEVPQLSAGEGIDISTVDGKTVITNNISAGSNISLVYDMETNTYRIDGQAGVDPASAVFSESARMPTLGLSYSSGVKISGGDETLYHKTIASFNTYISAVSLNGPYVTYLTADSDVPTDLHPVTSEHWNNIITATKEVSNNSWNWNNTFNTVTANSASWGQGGGTVVSPYGTIITNGNSVEASISGLIPEHISSAATVSANTSLYAQTAIDYTNTIYLNSANTVFFSAYESQWVTGNVALDVYENGEKVTSFNGTAFNFSTAYSEPTNVYLTYMCTPNGVPLTATISSNYAVTIPDEIVNLYEPSPATQSAIDSKSQIGVIMGSYSTAYTDIYNPAKDAKLIISGETSYADRGRKVTVEFDKNGSTSSLEAGYLVPKSTSNGIHKQILSQYYDRPHWISIASITSGAGSAQINYLSGAIDYVSSNAGLYTGVDPIQVNNTDHEISITGESLSAGPGIDMFSSGGYVVISSNGAGGSTFPITGTNGTTGFTANMDCSSMMLTTGASPAGGYVKQTVRGVQYEAYPATDVSASWYNIINAANNINVTCSAVKLTTAASENWFYTSALPNLNEITFIAPSYGPYETYSALIDDGETTFVAEVDSGCCMKVVRNWNDDRNKNCWCGLNQETYFYIG